MKISSLNIKYLFLLALSLGLALPAAAENDILPLAPKGFKGIEIADSSLQKDSKGKLVLPEIKIPSPADTIKRLAPLTREDMQSIWQNTDIVLLGEDYSAENDNKFMQTAGAVNMFIIGSKGLVSSIGFAAVNDVEQDLARFAADRISAKKMQVETNLCPFDVFISDEDLPQNIKAQVNALSRFIPAPCALGRANFMFINSKVPLGLYIVRAAQNNMKIYGVAKLDETVKHKDKPFWYYEFIAKGNSLSLSYEKAAEVMFHSIASIKPSSSNKTLIIATTDMFQNNDGGLVQKLKQAGYRIKVISCLSKGQPSLPSKVAQNIKTQESKFVEYAPVLSEERKFFNADAILWI